MSNLFARRSFLQGGAVSCLAASSGGASPHREPAGRSVPIGLQLYTVGKEMAADPIATLKRVADVGYREVELSPPAKITPKELRKTLDDLGLKNPAGHYVLPDLLAKLPENVDAAKELGEEYMVITFPWVADISRIKRNEGEGQMESFLHLINNLTLDDYKWSAEQCNKVGEQVKKVGLQLAYHNHNFEFRSYDGVTGYDELLRLTDPNLLKLELDCGWMTVAGKDPIAYLHKYPDRYTLLHIRDFKKGFTPRTTLMDKAPNAPVPTELSRGVIDYSRIFGALEGIKIRAAFVERDPPFTDMPALESIKVDFDYLRKFEA